MAKYVGMIGYEVSSFDGTDKYTVEIVEKPVKGDLLRNANRWDSADKVNDDLNITNRISIVADPYATQNFHLMKYATFMGTKWKITSIEVLYPRLVISLGGVWNGN